MGKLRLRGKQMASQYVSDARKWADHLVMREYQGPGQMDRAMDRASQKTGVDRGVFWSLRYRPPGDILVSVYMRIKAAYEADCQRLERAADHERSITRTSNAVAKSLVKASDSLARKGD